MLCFNFECENKNCKGKNCEVRKENEKKFQKLMKKERQGPPIKGSWEDIQKKSGDLQ